MLDDLSWTVPSHCQVAISRPARRGQRLSVLFRTSESAPGRFVEEFAGLDGLMKVPARQLTRHQRQGLNLALFYGLPCDFYLFDGRVSLGSGVMKVRCQEAFWLRQKAAGMILATDRPQIARDFGGCGAVLHHRKVAMFKTVEEAIKVFEGLPQPEPQVPLRPLPDSGDDDEIEF